MTVGVSGTLTMISVFDSFSRKGGGASAYLFIGVGGGGGAEWEIKGPLMLAEGLQGAGIPVLLGTLCIGLMAHGKTAESLGFLLWSESFL